MGAQLLLWQRHLVAATRHHIDLPNSAILGHRVRWCSIGMQSPKWLDQIEFSGLVSNGVGGRFELDLLVDLIGMWA